MNTNQSIKLKGTINNIIFEQNGSPVLNKDYKENTINGDFNHYIRLLRLENTEIITKLGIIFLIKHKK